MVFNPNTATMELTSADRINAMRTFKPYDIETSIRVQIEFKGMAPMYRSFNILIVESQEEFIDRVIDAIMSCFPSYELYSVKFIWNDNHTTSFIG